MRSISAVFLTVLKTAGYCTGAILWSAGDEENLHQWFSSNYNVDVHAYPESGKYCVVNNTYEPQSTIVYKGDGESFSLDLEANQIIWYEIG